jgi:hypothetical protein
MARVLFKMIEHRSEEDRHLVFCAIREQLGDAVVGEHRVELAGALRACATACGLEAEQVSIDRYRNWLRSRDGEGAPPVTRITRLGEGRWPVGRARALGLPVLDPTSRRLYRPYRHEPEAILASLRLFDANLPAEAPRSYARYREWAVGYASTAGADGVRIPLTGRPIVRTYGSWELAFSAAGLPCEALSPSRRVPRGWSNREDAVAALRTAAGELEAPVTMARYNAWRADELRERPCAPGSHVLPPAETIARRFGGWRLALKACLGADTPVARGARPHEYSDVELAAAWARFREYAGERLTEAMWMTFRNATVAADGRYTVPAAGTLARRVAGGSWFGVRRHFGQPAPRPERRFCRWTDAELRASWRACARDRGAPPASRQYYTSWRQRIRESTDGPAPPSAIALLERLTDDKTWRQLYIKMEGIWPPTHEPIRTQYSPEEIQDAWTAAERAAGRVPTISDYNRFRSAAGLNARVPSVHSLITRYGTWCEAQHLLSGIPTPTQPQRFTDEDLIASLRAYLKEVSAPHTIEKYKGWRARRALDGESIADVNTITCRLGERSWPKAIARYLPG